MSADELDVAARRLVALAELDDRDISELMEQAARHAGGVLVGLDNRIKTVESLRRKLADLVGQDPTLTVEEATEQVYDVLRFTVVAEAGRYMATHDAVLAELRSREVDVVAETNRWAGPGYRGINMRLRVGDARRLELQFHTRESFEAAKATRGLYEEYRLGTTPPERRAELFDLLDNAFTQVSVPPGAVP